MKRERRHEILSAAFELLRDGDVDAARTAKIAARAQCSKETLFTWFGDRDGIFADRIETQSARFNEIVETSFAQATVRRPR